MPTSFYSRQHYFAIYVRWCGSRQKFSRHSRINPSVDIKYIGEELVRGEKYLQQQDSHEPSENF